MILVKRKPFVPTFLSPSIWSLGKKNKFLHVPSKLPVLLLTNIWVKLLEKKISIWDVESTLGILLESIKCCHVLVPIDFKLVWEELSVNQWKNALELKSVNLYTLSDVKKKIFQMPLKPWEKLKTNSLVNKELFYPRNGVSLTLWENNISKKEMPEDSSRMVSTLNQLVSTDPCPDYHCSDINDFMQSLTYLLLFSLTLF